MPHPSERLTIYAMVLLAEIALILAALYWPA